MSRIQFLCLALAASWLFAAGGIARAEINIGSTLEWLTCSSDVVVVGRLEKVTTERGPGDLTYHDCQVKVSETIAGKVKGDSLTFCMRMVGNENTVQDRKDSRELLIFLEYSKDHGPEKRLEGVLVPSCTFEPFSVIDLAHPGNEAFDTKFNVLKDGKKILETCRQAAKACAEFKAKNPKAILKAKNLDVPSESAAWKVLWAGSSCYLRAPDFVAAEK